MKHLFLSVVFIGITNTFLIAQENQLQDSISNQKDNSTSVIESDTTDPEANLSLSARYLAVYTLVSQEKYEDALREIETILKLDSSEINIYLFGSICYQNLNNIEKSIDFANKAVKLDPTKSDAYFILAQNYFKLKDFEKAEEYIETSLYYDNKYVKAHILQAKVDFQKGDRSKAINSLSNISKQYPRDFECRFQLSRFFLLEGDTSEFLSNARTALKMRPNNLELLKELSDIMYSKEIYEELIPVLSNYLKVIDTIPDYYYQRGYAHIVTGDTINALRDFNSCIYLDHNNADAFYYRSIARNSLFDRKGACEDLKKAIGLGKEVEKDLENEFCDISEE